MLAERWRGGGLEWWLTCIYRELLVLCLKIFQSGPVFFSVFPSGRLPEGTPRCGCGEWHIICGGGGRHLYRRTHVLVHQAQLLSWRDNYITCTPSMRRRNRGRKSIGVFRDKRMWCGTIVAAASSLRLGFNGCISHVYGITVGESAWGISRWPISRRSMWRKLACFYSESFVLRCC